MLSEETMAYEMSAKQAGLSSREVPVEENLKMRKSILMKQVADIDSALEALNKNPEILGILNLMRKVGI